MTNPTIAEILVRDRQGRLEDAARHYHQVHELPVTVRAPLRTSAGWLLVRTGLRLVRIDPRYSPPPSLVRS